MKGWYLTGGLAVLSLGFLIQARLTTPGPILLPGPRWGPGMSGETFGSTLGLVIATVLTVVLFRRNRLDQRIDRSGPVTPADDPAVALGTHWSLDQIAGVLAREVAPVNGLVFADERTSTLRVMIDPPHAIVWSPATTEKTDFTARQAERWQQQGGPRETPAHYTGHWTLVRLRRGELPEVRTKSDEVSVRTRSDGSLIPLWDAPGDDGRTGSQALDRAKEESPTRVDYDLPALTAAIDRIAVRAGWITRTQSGARPPQPDRREAMAEARERLDLAERADTADDSSKQSVRPSIIMAVIGAVILVGCVLGTVIGLVFGMPWWASFIIIGSGLVFCLLFVLPIWLIDGRPRPNKSS